MSNSGLHPMELRWALEKIAQEPQPPLHSKDEGDIINVAVSSYLSYANKEVDIDGNPIFSEDPSAKVESTYRLVTFKAARYSSGPARHERWLEWVLA